MWKWIILGFIFLRSQSQTAAPVANKPSGVMPMVMPIDSYQFTAGGPIITTPMQGGFQFTSQRPIITSPMFDNTGASKIMSPSPALGGSAGFEF